jgi:hypothetical protein
MQDSYVFLVCVQRSKNTGFSCYNVKPFPKSLCSTLFAIVCKRPTEGGPEAFGFCLLELYFGLFGVESFWKEKELLKRKIAEGKGLVEGKMLKGKRKNCWGELLKGKLKRENPKEGLIESLH